jgi:hypothetical protein
LPAALELEFPLGVVVVDRVAGDVRKRVALLHVLRAAPDHDRELHLPIGLLRAARDLDLVVGALERGGRFHEHHGLFRDRRVGLARVLAVIEADAHDLARALDGRPQSGAGLHLGAARCVGREPRGEPLETALGEERFAVVLSERRDVEKTAVGGDHAGLFGAGRTVSKDLHSMLLSLARSEGVPTTPPSMGNACPVMKDDSSEQR